MRGRPSSPTAAAPRRRRARSCPAGLGADQRQRLGDGAALGLEVVGPPEHQRDGLGQPVAVGQMPIQQDLRVLGALAHREYARQPEGIEAVQVAPGRQDLRRTQQVAARCRPHEAAFQRTQDRRRLVILRHQLVVLASCSISLQVLLETSMPPFCSASSGHRLRPGRDGLALTWRASQSSDFCLGNGHQQVRALLGVRRLADHMQPCGIRVYSSSSSSSLSLAMRASESAVHSGSVSEAASARSTSAACAWISAASSCAPRPTHPAPSCASARWMP
jgi:hypothetical protein